MVTPPNSVTERQLEFNASDREKIGQTALRQSTENLVLIDSNIEGGDLLLMGLLDEDYGYLLTSYQDGIEQISYILSEFEDVKNLHIVSHGSPGCMKIGSTSLTAENLDSYADLLKNWSEFLAVEGRVLIYGCQVAEGDRGLAFVHQLREILGVEIAASSTLTGHANQGGNWQLDVTTEPMAISLPFTPQALEAFVNVLAGEVIFSINLGNNDIQKSNFGNDSFEITNVGDKAISQVEIDVTGALYPDSVFDPSGDAGDTSSKALTINTDGGTGVVSPGDYDPYVGIGGTAGYEGLILLFDETVNGGFEPGEQMGFSIDMDPNSVAGSAKSPLDAGSDPDWDVGGVSGAELIGSTVIVTFVDGTTATGQLMGDGTQAGSQALISETTPDVPVSLSVNGLAAGGIGTYGNEGPTVIVNGPAGETVRVVLTKGFIQPVTNEFYNSDPVYAEQLQAQLDTLAAQDFPANNAVEFQTVDIVLTGTDQDISDLFDFSGVADYDFIGETQLPIGLVASAIDPTNQNLPIGPVTQPIYLTFEDVVGPTATINSTDITILDNGLTSYTFTVTYADSSGIDASTLGNDDVIVSGPNGYTTTAVFVDSVVGTNGDITATYALVPPNGSWSSDDDGEYTITVQAGSVVDNSVNTNGIVATQATFVADLTSPPPTETVRIEAEDYKDGGQGVGYFDDTAGNTGGAYRTDDVDIESTGDEGGGFNIGWTKPGEWLVYDVTIPASGTYDIALRVATPKSDTKTMEVTIGGQTYTASFTDTGGWQDYQDVIIPGVNLTAGTQELRVDYLSDNFNFNYVELRPADTTPVPNTAPTTSGLDDIAVLEGAADTVIDLYPAFADAETADAELTYTVEGNTNPSLFVTDGISIDPSTGQLTLDYAVTGTGSADLTVRATDPDGEFVETTFTVTVTAPAADETAPAGSFSAPELTVSDSMFTYFDVTYTDPSGVDVATLDGNDLAVVNTNGGFALPATLVTFEDDGDDTSVTATYAIRSPGDRWDDVDNGTYSVSLVAGEVADTAGNVTTTSTDLGDLSVNITPDSAPLDFTNFTFVDVDGNKPEQVLIDAVSGDLVGTTFVFDATAVGGLIPHFHKMGNPQFLTNHNGADNGEQINFTMARQDSEAFSFSGFSYTSGAHMPNGDPANSSFTVIGTTADGQTVTQSFGPADAPGVFQSATLDGAGWDNLVSVNFLGDEITTQTTPDGNLVLTQSLNLDNIVVGAAVVAPQAPAEPIRIEAEDYKDGGQGVGYFDDSAGNTGGAYRTDDVDIESTGDEGGGFNIGWTKPGEWLAYDVTVPASGTYDIALRVATPKSDTKTLEVTIGGQTYTASFSNTGGWQEYQDVVIPGVNLTTGSQELRVDYLSDNFNFNYIELRPTDTTPVPNTAPTTTGLANVAVLEGAVDTVIDLYPAFADAETADAELSYTVEGNTNPGLFATNGISIDPATGQLTLDYAATGIGSADLTVRATDPDGEFVETTFTVTVTAPVADETAPTGNFSAPELTISDAMFTYVDVTYTDPSGVDVSTLDGNDLTVVNTNGGFPLSATLVDVEDDGDDTSVTATYAIRSPGDRWDDVDNGTYSVSLVAGDVADTAGNVTTTSTDLGDLSVNITPDSAPLDFTNFTFVDVDGNKPEQVLIDAVSGDLVGTTFVFDATAVGGLIPHFHKMGNPQFLTQHNGADNGEQINFTMARQDGEAFSFSGFSYTSGAHMPNGELANGSFTVIGTTAAGQTVTQSFGSADAPGIFQAVTLDGAGWDNLVSVNFLGDAITTEGTPDGNLVLTQSLNLDNLVVGAAVVAPPAPAEPIRIEAEDYKDGGQGVGYFDSSVGNNGGAYRADDVDIQSTGDDGGGFNIGWTAVGEWLAYDVTIPASGTYDIALRVATPKSDTKTLEVTIGGQTYTASFTNTGGWQEYQDVIIPGGNLSAGTQELRVDYLSDNFNFNYIELRPAGPVENQAPATTGIADITVTEGAETSAIALYDIFEDDFDTDAELTYSVENTTNPALFATDGISIDLATGQLTLDYAATGTGSADITVRATDSEGLFTDTTFTVTVVDSAANTPPTTSGLENVTVSEGAADTLIDLYPAFADAETLDADLVYTVEGNSDPSLFTAVSIDAATGQLTLDYAPSGTGTANLTVRATDPEGAFAETTFAVTVNPDSGNGNQLIRVQAEDYREGGQGDAYFDDTPGNQYGQYRNDDVDIEQTGDVGGGFNIGAIKPGEWLTYDVTLSEPGLFKVVARVATAQNDTKTIKATIGGVANTVSFSNTGGWQSYQDVTVIEEVSLPAGNHVLRFDSSSASFNLNYLDLVSLIDVTNPTASMPPVASDVTIGNGSKGNYILTVNYADNVAIDPATIDGSEISITGPNGFSAAPILVGLIPNADGSALKATYEVAPPGGTWDFADQGTYTVSLLNDQVTDTSGLFVSGGQLGTFPVNINEEDHFLHVVIDAPAWVIDYDGDGDEIIPLRGNESHTHEFGAFLTGWTWTNNGIVLGTGESITTRLGVGAQEITLTIEDNKAQTLADSEIVNVYPLNAIGGVLTEYYTTGGQPLGNVIDALPTTPGFMEVQAALAIAESNNTLGESPFTGDVVAVLTGDFEAETTGAYDFQVAGGVESRLYINGNLVTAPINLSAGMTYDLEVRVARAADETSPIEVLASIDGSSPTVLTPNSLTHDQSTLTPFINRMPVQGSEFGGEVVTIEGLGFFEGDAADEVSVQWGDVTLSGDDLNISRGEIKLLAPSGNGTVAVTVTTPSGTSEPTSYSYNPSFVPIDFTDPQVVANVAAPTQAAWGPDGRLYVASIIGTVTALEFDDNYNLLTTQDIAGVSGLSNSNILGIAFNPFDTEPKIYVAHSELFPGEDSAYVGQISVLEGPNFSTVTPLVTGLPVSNHDHGINGMAFDNNGDLLVAVGGNTNAGIVSDKMGWLPESPLSAAVLKVHLTDSDFNGNVTYIETDSGIENNLQADGDIVDIAPGVDVSVYAPGFRNPYDIVFSTKGFLYGTDNGPNGPFGAASTSATTQTADGVGAPDELVLITENSYYGHPNRNRGRYDDRQNVYYDPNEQVIPDVYTPPLSTLGSSSNGIDEYRSMAFKGQMYGDLIIQKWNDDLIWANLSETGDAVINSEGEVITQNLPTLVTSAQGNDVGSGGNVASGLDVLLGPGGAIVGVDYSDNSVTVSLPDDISVTATSMVAYDILPWRSPAAVGGREFVIGGSGFGNLSNTSVQFGDLVAQVTEISNNRIYGIIPQDPTPTNQLLDITVTVDTKVSLIPDAFQYLV